MQSITAAAILFLLATTTAHAADESRDLCADRPGRGSPPCVLDVGRLQVEASLLDFTHDRQAGATADTTLYGDLALRFGVTATGEAQLGFSPYVRESDKDSGGASRSTGHSDLTLAWRQSLRNPDGSGVSIAIQPFTTAPVGSHGFGAGGWQGGVMVPMAFALSGGFALGLTPQVAVVRNAAGAGVHLDSSGAIGLSRQVGALALGAELYVDDDDDPAGRVTRETFDLTGAWTPARLKDTQFDVGMNAGLDRNAPDYEVYAGIAHRF